MSLNANDPDWTHAWVYRQKDDHTFEDVTTKTPFWDKRLQSLGNGALVDFDNFFLVESFAHLVARQAVDAGDAVVRLTEMLPGPDELFATGPDGPRTSELRMGFYRLPG